MPDKFEHFAAGLESPLSNLAEITPNDGADLAMASRALYVGTSGNVRVTTVEGQTVTLANLTTGLWPIRVVRIHSTGTTATDILAGW